MYMVKYLVLVTSVTQDCPGLFCGLQSVLLGRREIVSEAPSNALLLRDGYNDNLQSSVATHWCLWLGTM